MPSSSQPPLPPGGTSRYGEDLVQKQGRPQQSSPHRNTGTTSTDGPLIHETKERIPQLSSAPSSGNNLGIVTDHPLSTSFQLPPPPLPPPPMRTTGNHTSSSRKKSSSSSTSSFSLPPPPRVTNIGSLKAASTTPPQMMSTPALGVSVMTAGISKSPVPPLPPPPPPRMTQNEKPPPPPPPVRQQLLAKESLAATPIVPPPFLPVSSFGKPSLPSTTKNRKEQRLKLILARRQTHVPILIVATEAANQLAWKNGLQLSDMFQGIVEEIKPSLLPTMTPFRSVNRSLFLKDIKVRFVTPSHFDAASHEETQEFLANHARLRDEDGDIDQDLTLLEDRIDELLQPQSNNPNKDTNAYTDDTNTETLEDVTKDAFRLTSPLDSMPWLVRYRQAVDQSTDGLHHDLINCPPLVLLVCTATKEVTSPENVLQELYQSNHAFPDVYKRGVYDPSSMRQEVLVLHDNQDDDSTFDEAKLRQLLRSRFGPNSSILKINSTSSGTAAALAEQEDTDPWGGKGKLGTFLSDNDRALLRRYFQSMVTAALLPSLERRIVDMNAIVNERKKGMRNLVKSFWRTSSSTGVTGSSSSNSGSAYGQSGSGSDPGGGGGRGNEVRYRYDSIESQTLLLADTLFLMEDYDNALSTYRLIRDDYKADKALVHYGNVLEMIALCIYQLDPYTRAREIFSTFEQALVIYTRAAEEERIRNDALAKQLGELNLRHTTQKSYATRLASRLVLVLVMASDTLAKGRDLECADLLASVSSYEASLGAAVLMEQSSVFYFKAGMCRKFAFHMLMSGHMFQKAGQNHHAFRCFTSALYVYRKEMWDKLYHHLMTALAAQLYTMQRMSVALVLYAKLIGVPEGGKVSIQSQQKFLQHLVEICEDHTKAALAGGDRMLVPARIPRNRRELFRNERLEQIVNIIQYTKGASRVLELPNVDLPKIEDSSVRVWARSDANYFVGNGSENDTPPKKQLEAHIFGKPGKGDEKIWEELEIMTIAEINNAALSDNETNTNQGEETMTAALSKIKDPRQRRFIAEIDKEKQNRSLIERSKRKNRKAKPNIRAREEPIFCDFVMRNPLGVEVGITELQIVARMRRNQTTCTNEFAISLSDDKSLTRKWTFACSDSLQFEVPQFCRVSEQNEKSCTSAQSKPFFVVSKHSVVLPPGGDIIMSAGISPLTEGDLEILGVRYKLLGKVWLYHAFDIPGPLLKDTRSNIMNKVRDESMHLRATIETNMPCLTAEVVKWLPLESHDVESDDGPMLEGQISTWTLRLRNVGTAAASAITLKTNLPWIDIVETNDASDFKTGKAESKAISHCLGPSGTLMALPIDNGKILPNECVDINIRVRTCGKKSQGFYMLYKYDNDDIFPKGSASTETCSRWLRKMYEVPVYPSLTFHAKPLTTAWKGKDILVSIELTNERLDRPTDLYVTLDRLSLASRRYSLEALPGQFTRHKDFGDILQIGWQERVTVFFRVILQDMESDSNDTMSVSLSECPFSESGSASTEKLVSVSAMNHLCLEDAYASFKTAWEAHQFELARLENTPEGEKEHPRSIASIRRANTSDIHGNGDGNDPDYVEDHPTSIGNLCPFSTSTSRIHLICSWRAILGQEVVHGQHYLRRVPIRPLSAFSGCPVAITADFPATKEHNFSQTPSAKIPIAMTLRNRMLETSVKFSWSLNEVLALDWVGPCDQLVQLGGNEEVRIPLDALISEPGVHNLQTLSLVVHQIGIHEQDKTYSPSQQWLVRVVDS